MSRLVQICKLGGALLDYYETLQLQHALHARRVDGRICDTLLLLQHTPVFTIGRRGAQEGSFLTPKSQLERMGFRVMDVDRGGLVTYHGPGQWVMYPIVHVRELQMGVKDLVTALEDVMLITLAKYGIHAYSGSPMGQVGVFTKERKLGAIGIQVANKVTMHGLALNVDMDLSPFSHIVPCGLDDVKVTSIAHELRRPVDMTLAGNEMLRCFIERLGYQQYRYLNPSGLVGPDGSFKVAQYRQADEVQKLIEEEDRWLLGSNESPLNGLREAG